MAKKFKTILEITNTHIKLLQTKEEQKGSIITFIIEDISSPRDEDISKKLQDLVKNLNIKQSSLNVVIPRNLITLRNVSFPSHNPNEIKEMIDLQSARFIPHSKEDVIIDYLILDKDPSGYSRVLLTIAHKDVIKRYLKIIGGSLSRPEIVSLSSQGVCSLYSMYQKKTNKTEEGIILLVDIDATTTDVCFYNKKLVFSRSISFGIKDFTGENLDNLIREFHLTLSTFKKETQSQEISKIILFSSGGIEAFSDRLKSEFSIPLEIINSSSIVSMEKGLSLPDQVLQHKCSDSVVLGFSANKHPRFIDLLPRGVHEEKEKYLKYKKLISLGILLVLAVTSIATGVFTRMHKKEQYIRRLEDSLKRTSPDVTYVNEMTKKLQLVKERLNPEILTIDILTELYKTMPENMSLSALEMDEGRNLLLEGLALAMSDVVDFQKRLTRSNYFSKVEIKYATKKKTKGRQVTDFKIACRMAK